MPHMSYQIYDSEFASKNIDLSDDGLTKTTIRTMSPDIYLRWLSDNDVHDTTDDALQEKHYLDNNIKITRIVEVIDA
jgi:hypothetical protein